MLAMERSLSLMSIASKREKVQTVLGPSIAPSRMAAIKSEEIVQEIFSSSGHELSSAERERTRSSCSAADQCARFMTWTFKGC